MRPLFFQFDACCTEALACGIDMSPFASQLDALDRAVVEQVFPAGFGPSNTCLPPGAMFIPVPGSPVQRVHAEGGPDILITPECKTYNVYNFAMPGCCLPSGRCGMSSHLVLSDTIKLAAPGSELGKAAGSVRRRAQPTASGQRHRAARPRAGAGDHRHLRPRSARCTPCAGRSRTDRRVRSSGLALCTGVREPPWMITLGPTLETARLILRPPHAEDF